MSIDKSRYAEMANESEHLRPVPIMFATAKLDGNTGRFIIREIGEDGTYDRKGRDLGDSFEGVILRIRSKLSEWSKTSKKSSSEFDSSKERIVVWETSKGAAVKVGEGSVEQMREKFQKLRYSKIVYMLAGDRVIKFRVKGGSLGHWFSYLQELGKRKLHTFEVVTRILPNHEVQEESGLSYYACVFEIAKQLSDSEWESWVQPHFERVNDNINRLRELYAKKVPKEDLAEVSLKEEVPEIDLDEANESEAEEDLL